MRYTLLGILLLATTAVAAQFPTGLYTHTDAGSSCSVPADCGVGTEAVCVGGVCKYSDVKIQNVAEEVEAIEAALCVNMSCVLDTADIDTSAEFDAIVTDNTGSGAVVFGLKPTLDQPVVKGYATASLPPTPAIGSFAVVTDAAACPGGTAPAVTQCRWNGSAWQGFAGSGTGGSSGVSSAEPTCVVWDTFAAVNDRLLGVWGIAVTVQHVGCHCEGTCSTPAQIRFEDDDGNVVGVGAITCTTGSGDMAWNAVSGGAAALDAGERLRYDTTVAPVPSGADQYMICARVSG